MSTDVLSTGSVSREQIVTEARSWLGTPYQHQASCKGAGCDCLGLLRGVYGTFWPRPSDIPPYSASWAEGEGGKLLQTGIRRYLTPTSPDKIKPGDVLLFQYRAGFPAKHVGILSYETHFIHAQQGVGVCQVSLSGWWRRHIAHAFIFPQNTV